MGIFGVKKEKKVYKLFKEHAEIVNQALDAFRNTMKDYIKGGKDFKDLSYEVHRLEHEADIIRRKVELLLNEGAFLPIMRDDLINIIESIDRIANKAESTADFLVLTKPEVPAELKDDIKTLTKESVRCFLALKEIISEGKFGGKKDIVEQTHIVEKEEQLVDQLQWALIDKLFKMDFPLEKKLHLKELIDDIAVISDRVEDASDKLSLMAIKQIMD